MKANRTIPLDLEDWLHSFRSALEIDPFPVEVIENGVERQSPNRVIIECLPLSAPQQEDNLTLSFAV